MNYKGGRLWAYDFTEGFEEDVLWGITRLFGVLKCLAFKGAKRVTFLVESLRGLDRFPRGNDHDGNFWDTGNKDPGYVELKITV